uniref:Uncharacterized protein n=1 Tax=Ditylenchus dipsaci TaxID=166011 RepID=A0A915ELY3_9BILA
MREKKQPKQRREEESEKSRNAHNSSFYRSPSLPRGNYMNKESGQVFGDSSELLWSDSARTSDDSRKKSQDQATFDTPASTYNSQTVSVVGGQPRFGHKSRSQTIQRV